MVDNAVEIAENLAEQGGVSFGTKALRAAPANKPFAE
jgi:hypothetical protein